MQLENYSKLMITCYIYKTTPEPEETMQKRGGTERLQELGSRKLAMYVMDAVYVEYKHSKCLRNTYRMTVPSPCQGGEILQRNTPRRRSTGRQ